MMRWRTPFVLVSILLVCACLHAGEPGSTPDANRVSGAQSNPPSPPLDKDSFTTQQRILYDTVPLTPFDTTKGLEKLTGFPTGEGNAASHYAKLEALYLEDRLPDSPEVQPYGKGVREIIAAVRIRDCRLTPDYYPHFSKGTNKQPDIIVFTAYTRGLINLARQLEERGDTKGADAVYRTGLIFGWHLTQDPQNLVTLMIGVQTKMSVTHEYASFLQRNLDMERSIAANDYLAYLVRVRTAITRKVQLFLNETLQFSSLYSTIRMALEDEQTLWRQEAVLRLGVYRHGAPSLDQTKFETDEAHQRLAQDMLIYLAEHDPKPWIRSLARWSLDEITPENFRTMRRMSNVYEQEPLEPQPRR